MRRDLIIPIYDAKVTVVITDEFEKEVLEAGYQKDVTGSGGITLHYPDAPSNFTIVMHTDCTSPGNIAHEAYHLCGKIMDCVDIKYDINNDEPMAYLIGFIVDGLHQIIFEGLGKGKNADN